MVRRFSRYRRPAKNNPARIKHRLDPKGSATTPRKPSLTNVAEMPSTVSAPNHVAKTAAGDREIRRRADPGRGIQSDADRHEQVEDDEAENHEPLERAGKTWPFLDPTGHGAHREPFCVSRALHRSQPSKMVPFTALTRSPCGAYSV